MALVLLKFAVKPLVEKLKPGVVPEPTVMVCCAEAVPAALETVNVAVNEPAAL